MAACTGAGVVGLATAWARSAKSGARALWRTAAAVVAVLTAWAWAVWTGRDGAAGAGMFSAEAFAADAPAEDAGAIGSAGAAEGVGGMAETVTAGS